MAVTAQVLERGTAVSVAHHKIRAVEVSGGFLDGAKLEFADGLNCIIGGRGTGKTTVLEFIRFILSLMPDPADNKPRARAIEGIVRGNLGSGTVRLNVETKHGTRYRAERPWDDSVQILDRDGDPVSVSLDRDLVFKADIYSQNEIEEIATTPKFQLALIDKFEEEAVRAIDMEIHRAKRTIEESGIEIRNLDRRIQEIEEVVPEIEVVGKRLQEMQEVEGPQADLINVAHMQKALRTREAEAVGDLQTMAGSIGVKFRRFTESIVEDCASTLGDGFREGPNGGLFQEMEEAFSEFVDVFQNTVPGIEDRSDAFGSHMADIAARLASEHARQEQQYRELIASSAQEQQKAAERTRLQQRHLELTRARNELDALTQKRRRQESSHREMTARLSDLRDQRFMLRKTVAERLSAALTPAIRVSIIQAGDRSGYEEVLRDALTGSGIQYNRVATRIVASLAPEELSQIIRKGKVDRLAERAGIAEEQAGRVVSHIRNSDFAARLEVIDLEDEPLIELKDGADFKNSAGLSTGQRCTVILPILLLESERPLLIDQPEDNLDNAFVYDTIVKSIRDVKKGRQLIFVTHNPNIPVLGEAEKVFVFTSDGRHGSVTHEGTVDDVKSEIEHLLEGGEEAFTLRMRRYGH